MCLSHYHSLHLNLKTQLLLCAFRTIGIAYLVLLSEAYSNNHLNLEQSTFLSDLDHLVVIQLLTKSMEIVIGQELSLLYV